MGFDDVINALVPFLILIIGGYLLYRPLKEPIHELISWIKNLFAKKEESSAISYPVIQYE